MKTFLLLSFFLSCYGALPPAPAQLDVRIPRTAEEVLSDTIRKETPSPDVVLNKDGHVHRTHSHLSGVIIESGNETKIEVDSTTLEELRRTGQTGSGSESKDSSGHSKKFVAMIAAISSVVVAGITAGVTLAIAIEKCKQGS